MANTKIPIELSSTPSIVDNGDATALTIDSSENVGFSITPESHYSDYTNLDFGKTGLLLSASSGTNITSLLNNAYLNSSTAWKYKEADEASKYDQTGGTHLWFTAPTGGSADADLTWTQRLRVDSDGLKFGSDTAAANALDDYEEGTYTPVMNSSNLTYSTQLGWYIKVGSHVTVGLYIDINTNGNGSGVAIGDLSLPFAAAMGAGQYATCGSIWCNAWSTATKSDVGILLSGTSAVVTRKSAGQASVATPTHGDLGTGNMLLTISYQTA